MKHSLFTKMLSVFLAALMLSGVFLATPVAAAQAEIESGEGVTTDEDGNTTYPGYFDDYATPEEVAKFMNLLTYEQYKKRHRNAPDGTESIIINAVEYDPEKTTASVEIKEAGYEGSDVPCVYMPDDGDMSWVINVPSTGMYALRITYTTPEGNYTSIERMLEIDGAIPFSEATYLYMPRSWEYEWLETDENGNPIHEFEQDVVGNDVRPRRQEDPVWVTYFMRDWLGYTMAPFEFYLTEGEHVITLSGAREPIAITQLEFYPYDGDISYEDFLAEKLASGAEIVTGVDNIIIEAEKPTNISVPALIPANDRTSCLTTPSNPSKVAYNVLSSGTINTWMAYEVEVPKAGLYNIACRYRQNSLIGMFTSRRVYINDQIQFDEASHLRFCYSPSWQCNVVTDDSGEEFLFYLEEGVNTIKIEVVLGDMEEYVYRMRGIIDNLETAYERVLQLTGTVPDQYRDYGFSRLVPDAIEAFADGAEDLYEMADELQLVTGEYGDQIQALLTVAETLEIMGKDEYKIAENFLLFKAYLGTLINWLYTSLYQPLNVDKWMVTCQDAKLPQAQANFFQQAWFEICSFFGSFFMDYDTIARKGDVITEDTRVIEFWVASGSGREGALIERHLIDNYFTPQTGIVVKMKVFAAGLTESMLAGVGPNIAAMGSNDTITWGMRNAIECLNEKDENGNYIFADFEEVAATFRDVQLKPLTMDGRTYGLPTGLSFRMMFYRSDILTEEKLKVPQTWTDLYRILPSLMNQRMEIAVPIDVTMFLYQNGGTLYKEDDPDHMGWAVNLDNKVALQAFEQMCEFFTKYKTDVVTDISRFRTGEVPIVFGDGIGMYNTLMGMVDIRGRWEMAPLPGVEREDGTINHTCITATGAMVIPRGADDPQATWEYMKWYLSEDAQWLWYKEAMALNASPTAKVSSVHESIILRQSWTDRERAAIKAQLEQLESIPEYPGNYITGVYLSNAFFDVYTRGETPVTALQNRVLEINREISRKRKEFGLGYYEI